MADRILLLFAVAAASVLLAFPADAARPCHTFLVSYSANANPNNDPDHRSPLTATFITVFRIRRLGPHLHRAHGDANPYLHPNHHHHLHSIPANIQIHRPELSHSAAGAATGIQDRERFKDMLVVVVGLLFGIGCGVLTAASMYLVWSVLAGPGASSHYDELYDDEDDEASDSESPKKVGYVIIPGVDVHDGGKN